MTQNPAPSAVYPSGDERVQPDGPLSGEVKRGGVNAEVAKHSLAIEFAYALATERAITNELRLALECVADWLNGLAEDAPDKHTKVGAETQLLVATRALERVTTLAKTEAPTFPPNPLQEGTEK